MTKGLHPGCDGQGEELFYTSSEVNASVDLSLPVSHQCA